MQKIKTINGVDYKLTKEEINVGDCFYSPFMGGIITYLDEDYGEFDPNILGMPKATPINGT